MIKKVDLHRNHESQCDSVNHYIDDLIMTVTMMMLVMIMIITIVMMMTMVMIITITMTIVAKQLPLLFLRH